MHPDPDRLSHVPLFAQLSDEDRVRIASWLDVEDFDAGKRLTQEGVASLTPGDVFGEMAMFGVGRRNADVLPDVAETLRNLVSARA